MSHAEAESELEVAPLRPDVMVSDRYRVEALLGRGQGGAATVYRVRDARGGQRVALKQLRLRGVKQDALLTSQFEREYHTLSELAHPSIIEVYDYGVEHSGPYYTMELLDGEDMRERGQLPFREVCALLCDVASSLAIVHSRNRVHRDVSARNVRCTRQGRAKLIDFGAMATTGKTHPLVGTPPFVPPEALQLQPLDGRVDLYALGALAYFMLTGRHAYPAETFSQLSDLWRSTRPTPRQYESSVPEALDRLVMELLQLERAARPRSAAEVMERLAGIAGLPLQELPEVQRAYLAVPMLVGRDAELKQARSCLVTALKGRGGSVLIEGAPGVGRSRMLDACVLEAKLLGAVVLRADAAGEGQRGQYALVRSICGQLLGAMPVLAEQSARPRRALLAHVLAPLGRDQAVGGSLPPRRQLQAALRDFFLAVAREQLIVIAVDDIQLADEASAALLGMLAHGAARRRLCLLLTAVPEADPSQVVALLRRVARPIALAPLRAEQTQTLVKSLFGDIEHVAPLSDRIHALSEGNPRWVMTLCERLALRGIARYHAGRWTLPAELGPDAIPSSLSAELAARIDALPPDARELAQTLALSDPAAFSLPDYTAISPHADHGRTYRALDALVGARVLVAANDRYQFSQPEFARLLQASVKPERAPFLHERLASALSGHANFALHAHHLLYAGRPADAVETIASHILVSNLDRAILERSGRTLARALEQQSGLGARHRFEATFHLSGTSAALGQLEAFVHHSPTLVEQLLLDSGLRDFTASTAGTLKERVQAALEQATQRHAQTAVDLRVFSPPEAMERLAWIALAFVAMGSIGQDLELLERMPSLAPFSELYPGIAVVHDELEIQREMQRGRPGPAFQQSLALVERLRQPDRAGLEPFRAQRCRMGQLYLQGLVRAGGGIEVPAELLAELEQVPGYRAQAWRVRMASEFVRCNFDEARACERRAALIGLQDGGMLPGTTVRLELLSHVYADDLTGVQQGVERTEDLAARYPGWRPIHAIARSHYSRLLGDLEAALVALQPALELTSVGRHSDWSLAVQSQIQVLTELGRADEAAACGRRAADQARSADVPLPTPFRLTWGTALLRAGDVEAARQLIDGALAELGKSGSRGLHLGAAYEARARVAIAERDIPALHHAAERCGQEFKVGENSVLNARYERLLREAHAAGMELPASANFVAAAASPQTDAAARTVYSRMLTCIGSAERAREALRLLLDESGARSGYLFGLRGGKLKLLSSVDETEAPQDLTLALEDYLRNELEDQDRSNQLESAAQPAEPLQPWIDSWGREFEPLLLVGAHEGDAVIAGIAVLHHEADEHPTLTRPLLQALTEALIAEDLIDPITFVDDAMPLEPDSAAAGLPPGTLLAGRFRTEAALGRGGMATVYRVTDERTGHALALKHLRAARDGDGPTIIAQLEREYHTLCQLAHPSIITVHDYGIEQGTPYYTMELLEGDDLHRTGKLPWPVACAILRDVASSLAVLHSRRLLHRDISTRNVRRTRDGRAKLIDFGAMMVMGVSKQTLGTPPFMPPEAVQLQSLDARADLYSLGALAYFLLTGYHAYHARSVSQLRALWRSPALPVREYEPEVPAALEALVSELLQLERSTRPARAAEVIERLSAIAGLPLRELPEVTRAYLLTPQLVGRKTQLEPLQDELRQGLGGAGRCLVLQGEAGSGRSRLLDAGVLEAKLQGAVVLRGDAADALSGDFGVARALCQQLLAELPELHELGKEFPRAVLGHVVPQWREQRSPLAGAPPMRALHGAVRAWFTWIARDKPLVVAVDDFEAADPPSAALLATLAQAAAQSRLVLLLATRAGVEPSGGQLLVQQLARVVSVPPLDATQSEALLRSVFGDIAHVAALSSRIHALARGNPRATLALCERLVERGTARYEAGSWELPATLAPADIPDSLTALLAQRIASLSADARELAEALAVTDPAAHHPSDYVLLTRHHDAERCYRALDALVASELLIRLGDRYRFSDEAFPARLQHELSPQRAQELHGMIAAILPPSCDPLVLAYHWLRAGREAQSVELLAAQPDDAVLSRSPHVLGTLEQVVTCAERIGAPLAVQTRLRGSLVGVAALRGDYAVFTRYARSLLERLQQDSGLGDYLELEPDGEARYAEAQRRARKRHDEAPERERPLAVEEAAYRMGSVYGHFVAMAAVAQDYEMVADLPSLAPLYRIFKTLEVADLAVSFTRSMQSGDFAQAQRSSHELLRRLDDLEAIGLPPDMAIFVRRSYQFVQGLLAASRGDAEALRWCAALQHDPRFRVHAWRVRMVYELTLGNPSMASACQRRAELLHLQDTGQVLPGTTVRTELTAHATAGDLLRVKRTLETIRGLADAYPGWRPTLALARSHYHRLQGDLNGALQALEPALSLPPGRHIDCSWVWASHVTLLSLLGRTDEALQRAREYRAHVERLYGPATLTILEPYARALCAAGRLDEASRVIQRCIELMEQAGMHGLVGAAAYETAARIALALRDQPACTNFIALCARQYKGGSRNPLFNARYEVLAREAEACGLQAPRPSAPPVGNRIASPAPPRLERALDHGLLGQAGQ